MRVFILCFCVLLAGCSPEIKTLQPGRGAAGIERGPEAKVYPSDGEAFVARHGLWQGLDDRGQRRWEVRYTRGNPTGAYREWDEAGDMIATWTYNWDGQLDGWARWFEDGEPVYKRKILPEEVPDFDPIGMSSALREWAEALPESEPDPPPADAGGQEGQ